MGEGDMWDRHDLLPSSSRRVGPWLPPVHLLASVLPTCSVFYDLFSY